MKGGGGQTTCPQQCPKKREGRSSHLYELRYTGGDPPPPPPPPHPQSPDAAL